MSHEPRQFIYKSLLLLIVLPLAGVAETTITYQGQLQENGQPLTGTPGMEFRLYDSLEGDNLLGSEFFSGVPVEDGLFQVELDFGAGAFDGTERYLEIEVAGSTLDPRQKLTSAPTAQYALEVASDSVGSAQIAAGAVGSEQLENDSLVISSGTGLQGGGQISLGGTVTLSIANDGVGSAQIAPGAVGADQLADDMQSKWTDSGGRLQPKAGQPDAIEVSEVQAGPVTDPDSAVLHADGNAVVTGHADIGSTGLSAYLSSNQTIQHNANTTVVFNATNADHFGGYDTSTGQYTVQEGGVYHISFTIDWQTNFDAGVNIDYELQINGSTGNQGIQADTSTSTSAQRVARSFSRTVFGLSPGDTIEVVVSQDSGSTADVFGSGQETYLTIYKAG